jgi:hypothetical protein
MGKWTISVVGMTHYTHYRNCLKYNAFASLYKVFAGVHSRRLQVSPFIPKTVQAPDGPVACLCVDL